MKDVTRKLPGTEGAVQIKGTINTEVKKKKLFIMRRLYKYEFITKQRNCATFAVL